MKIVKAMYFTEAADDAPVVKIPVLHMICLAVLAIPTLVRGLYWGWLKAVIDQAVMVIAGL